MSSMLVVSFAPIGVPHCAFQNVDSSVNETFGGILSVLRRSESNACRTGLGISEVREAVVFFRPIGTRNLFAQERVQRFLADLGEDLAEYHEVGVRVAPVGPGSELHGAGERVFETLFKRPDVERICAPGCEPPGIGLERTASATAERASENAAVMMATCRAIFIGLVRSRARSVACSRDPLRPYMRVQESWSRRGRRDQHARRVCSPEKDVSAGSL